MDGFVDIESEFEEEYVLISVNGLETTKIDTKLTNPVHETGRPSSAITEFLLSKRNRMGIVLTLMFMIFNIVFFSLMIHVLWFHQSPSLRRHHHVNHVNHVLSTSINETTNTPNLPYNHALWNGFHDTTSPYSGYIKMNSQGTPLLDFGPIGPIFRKDGERDQQLF